MSVVAVFGLLGGCAGSDVAKVPTVVHVQATGCGDPVAATGFFAGRRLVLTVAHALRGATAVDVDGRPADVVALDYRRDAAVLEVLRADGARVSFADPVRGAPAAMLHWTEGNITRTATVISRIPDITIDEPLDRTSYTRKGLFVDTAVHAGDSGAPILDERNRVVGMVFAVTRTDEPRSYGVAASELQSLIAGVGDGPARSVTTGPCTP
jgi:S1-C subfamily serine protease